MCTAITYNSKHHYFGRNLDLEHTYGESVVVTPRNFPFQLRAGGEISKHYAMIGIATVIDGYPLYYDATNEHGLSMAGLNFVGNAHFYPRQNGFKNLAQFELIPYILGNCRNIGEAKKAFERINLVGTQFSDELPTAELHWMLADKSDAIVVEPMADGLKIYDDPVGVLTNNPPFPFQLYNLKMYMNITAREPENRFSRALDLSPYSRGMGAIGLPGDPSSPSRFVRAAFIKHNSVTPEEDVAALGQFFHILGEVEQVEGSVKVGDRFERTQYSSCCNTDTGVYYYKTYSNSRITAVRLSACELNGETLSAFPLELEQDIRFEN